MVLELYPSYDMLFCVPKIEKGALLHLNLNTSAGIQPGVSCRHTRQEVQLETAGTRDNIALFSAIHATVEMF